MISTLALFLYSSSGGAWLWVAGGALGGVYIFYRGFRLLQRKRLILDTPASKIRSASMGLVEVNGLATGPYTMTAPITGVPCYYFRTTVWQWQRSGKSNEWVKVADESLHVPFFLDDNTGRVLVDPQGAEMDIHRDYHDEFSTSLFSGSFEIPANVSTFLARNGVSTDKKLKVEEYCIKPKNALFILGTLAQNPGLKVTATPVRSVTTEQHTVAFSVPGTFGSLSFSTGVTVPKTIMFTAFKGELAPAELARSLESNPALASDPAQRQKISAALVKAGISNPAAWAAAGVDPSLIATSVMAAPVASVGGSAAAPAAALEQFDLHPATVLLKGAHDPAFFISWRSQRDVVKALGWKSALMIWGGPALTLLCVYILALHFDWL